MNPVQQNHPEKKKKKTKTKRDKTDNGAATSSERLWEQANELDNTKYQNALTLLRDIDQCNVMGLCIDRHLNGISVGTFWCHVFQNDPEKAVECLFEFDDRLRTSLVRYASTLQQQHADGTSPRDAYDAFTDALLPNGCVFRLYEDVNNYLGNHSDCHDLFGCLLRELASIRAKLDKTFEDTYRLL
jgi:hypothetical protein